MGSRFDAFTERLQREQAELLRQHLNDLQAEGAEEMPPAPSARDRAVAAQASPAERERVDALLIEGGYTADELACGYALRDPPVNDAVDDLTRARARALLGRTDGGRA